jgi:methylase of polypeptide subunit release factors
MSGEQQVRWVEAGHERWGRWLSGGRATPPARVVLVDDALSADAAFRLASQGTALLWRGDFRNARQLLDALGRRLDRRVDRQGRGPASADAPAEAFHRYRRDAALRAHILGSVLVELDPDGSVRASRAPNVASAVREAVGPDVARAGSEAAVADDPGRGGSAVIPLRELLGMVGAHEWRKRGVEVRALGARVHPHYGVFAPIRQEYVELVASAPMPASPGGPAPELALDVGTGTGVLAAVLARRGVARVVATDNEGRAVACARENMARLGLADRVDVVEADLFPPAPWPDRVPLVVCNPPWLPAKAATPLERAVYDPDSRTLRRFLAGLPRRLAVGGEGWLVLSDLAERLGLRSRSQLESWIEEAGLRVVGRIDGQASHPRADDPEGPLHAARRAEVTSLWRLAQTARLARRTREAGVRTGE